MADLAELLERVKAASGPDRETDVALWLAMTPGATYRTTRAKHTATGREWDINESRVNGGALVEVPTFTASLDAALALVERVLPEDRIVTAGAIVANGTSRGMASVTTVANRASHTANGATPALALLAATLSALIAQPASGDVGSANLKETEA